MLAATTLAHAATIFSRTQYLTSTSRLNPSETWEVSVTSTLFDNFNGDFSKREWRYTLTNLSYVPDPLPPGVGTLVGNGITFFYVPVFGTNPLGGGPFQNYFEPPGWGAHFFEVIGDNIRLQPVSWRTSSAPLLVGESADFGFSITGPITISTTNALMTTEQRGCCGPVEGVFGSIFAPVPVFFPEPVPEPGTLSMLLGAIPGGLLVLEIRRHSRTRLATSSRPSSGRKNQLGPSTR